MIASLRHFTEADLPLRTELLRDDKFQTNLTDFATLTDTDALIASQRRTIEDEHDVKRIFTVCGTKPGSTERVQPCTVRAFARLLSRHWTESAWLPPMP
jgi:hypothetical protein